MPDGLPVPADDVTTFFPGAHGCRILVLRLDRLHPVVSGNKWFKLKYNLEGARLSGARRLLTFGGAYSNHLVAAAAAARSVGMAITGVVRGLHAQAQPTPTLQACADLGMQLHFVPRAGYAQKDDPRFLEALQRELGAGYVIPEGGDNEAGRKGAAEIASLVLPAATTVCVPVGTGTTFAGLRAGLPPAVRLLGFTAMKGGEYLHPQLIGTHHTANSRLMTAYSAGFARTTPELLRFVRRFFGETGIPLDIVYTGKMLYGLQDLLQQRYFRPAEQIVCIHTGGLQGNPPGLFDPSPETR